MSGLLDNLIIQTALLPLAIALAVPVIAGRRWAGGAIGIGFLAAYLAIVGLPALPPPSALGKAGWALAGGVALGLAADTLGWHGRAHVGLFAGWLAAALLWLALPVLRQAETAELLKLAVLAAGAAVIGWRLVAVGGESATPSVMVIAAALAVGAVGLIGASASVGQLGFALAAATGGFLLWNWPHPRHNFGAVALIGAGGGLILLATVLVLFTQARGETLLLAVPLFFVDRLARRLPFGLSLKTGGAAGPALGAVVLGGLALVPALLAIAAAFGLSTPDSGAYGSSGY